LPMIKAKQSVYDKKRSQHCYVFINLQQWTLLLSQTIQTI
jgi:hypothetical protein